MKKLCRMLSLMMAICLLLCSCSKKVKPEEINTKDFSREIQVGEFDGDLQIIHSDKSTESAQSGQTLQSDDTLQINGEGSLRLDVDEDKHILIQGDSRVRMEASGSADSGKTRIHLEQGGVMAALDEFLGEGELFQVQTDSGLISALQGILRVSRITIGGKDYTLVEVLEGEAEATILKTGEKMTVPAGSAVLIREDASQPGFVPADAVDAAAWAAGQLDTIGTGTTGDALLPIPYESMPASVLEELLREVQAGHKLPVSEEAINNLIETGHDYVELESTEPSCEEDGKRILKCSFCGEGAEEITPALGHTEEEIPAVEATCTADGLTAGVKCSVCGKILQEQEAVPAKGHEIEKMPDDDPSCTEDGNVGDTLCVICGEVIQPGAVVRAHGHQAQEIPGVEPTCTEDGLSAVSVCSICGKILEEQQSISALGHTPVVVPAVASTCTEHGLTEGSRCSECGETLTAQEETPLAEHTLVTMPGREPTCSKVGLTEGSRCGVCGKILVRQKVIAKLDHTIETDPAVEATCTETGLTEGSHCSVCGEILNTQETTPELVHTPVTMPGREPTCSKVGLTEGSRCSECGKILTRQTVIAKLEHTPKTIHGIYPMCFRDGCTDGLECSVCGEILEQCQVIPALEHTPGGLAGEEPTCSSVGWTDGLACQICGCILKPREMIEKLAHTPGTYQKVYWDETPVLDANGNMIWDKFHHPYCYQRIAKCTECGEICDIQYYEHCEGSSVAVDVGTAQVCQKVSVYCGDCGKLIRTYTTSHTAGAPRTESSGETSWTVTDCGICGIELSRVQQDVSAAETPATDTSATDTPVAGTPVTDTPAEGE